MMKVSNLFAVTILLSLVTYCSCTVLAVAGYAFSNPTVRDFMIRTGLGNAIGRKASTLYDISNFRNVFDRGTDIKEAKMDKFEIVETHHQRVLKRTGLHVHESNYTNEDRLYSEKLFGVLNEMDRNGCISRLLCEIGGEPKSFGLIGMKINSYLRSVPPVTWNSATFPYQEAFQAGFGNKAVCGQHYPACAYDLKRVMKFLWPFLAPLGLKLSSGL